MPDPAPASPLQAHLGYWLRFVSNHVAHAFARTVQARGVTVAEWVVLRALFDHADPITPSRLAADLGLTRGAVSKLTDRLAAKALLTRTTAAHDRRYQAVALTPAGLALVPELAALADRNDTIFFGHLAPADRAALEHALQDIVRRHDLRGVPIA